MQLHHIGAVHRQCAVRDVMHAVDGADQRGFACAGKADDGHELALSNGQVNVLQRLEAVGVFFVYMFEFNHLINLTLSKKEGAHSSPSFSALHVVRLFRGNQAALFSSWIIFWAARSES